MLREVCVSVYLKMLLCGYACILVVALSVCVDFVFVCKVLCMYKWICVCECEYLCVCVYVCICVSVCVSVSLSLSLSICQSL